MDRHSILQSLLVLDRPIENIRSELAQFAWDDAPDLVSLTSDHVRSVLNRFLTGEISADAVEAWADTIEMRDDISFEAGDKTNDAIFVLANPEINQKLDNYLAAEILANVSE